MSRFNEPTDAAFDAINRSLDVDQRLWPFDIAQSRAHVAMLAAKGIIPEEDAGLIHDALEQVAGELEAGIFPFEQSDEDIHMAVERRVSEIAGPAGGRSRPLRRERRALLLRAPLRRAAPRLQDSSARAHRRRTDVVWGSSLMDGLRLGLVVDEWTPIGARR